MFKINFTNMLGRVIGYKKYVTFMFLLSLSLTGCGGGGGGSSQGNGDVPESHPYFPVASDLKYYYNDSLQPVSFVAKTSKGGKTLLPMLHPTNAKEYFSSATDALSFCGFYSPSVYVSGAGYYTIDVVLNQCQSLFSLNDPVGVTINYSGSGTVNISPTYGNRSFSYYGSKRFVGDELITTPLGTYNTKHIAYSFTYSINISGAIITLPFTTELWLAENIGVVRRLESYQYFNLTGIEATDTDNDGVFDSIDAFPNDPLETIDTDGDGIGNNADTDDDNDGVEDVSDALPLNPDEQYDMDGDGIGDNSDPDIDGDGVNNNLDTHPTDPAKWMTISAAASSVSLTAVYGSSEQIVQQPLQIVAPGLNWQVTDSTSWLSVSSDTGSNTSNINVIANSTGLALGVHSAQLTLTDIDTLDEYVVDVNLSILLPTLSVTQSSLNLDGSFGWSSSVLTNSVSLNTGSNSYPVSVDVTFPLTNAASGVVNNNVGSIAEDVLIALNTDNFVAGTHSGNVTLTADINGELVTASFSISVIAGEHIIYAPDNGVALSSFLTGGKLSHNIKVLDSYASTTTPWTAVSSETWLTVTTSGVAGGEITLTADPLGLSTNTIHYALVTVTSSLASVTNTETIRVAFWVGDADPAQRTDVNIDYVHMVADPLRPYVYLNTGGNTLYIYNVYTGQLVTTESIITSSLGRMSTSHDGSYLFVKDITNNQLVRINLDNFTQKDAWASTAAIYEYSRPLGQPILLTEAGYAMDADTGVIFALATPTLFYGTSEIDSSLHGNRYCMINRGLSPSTIKCFDLGYNSMDHSLQITSLGTEIRFGGNAKDIALNNDGSIAYAVAGGYYSFGVIDTSTMTLTHGLTADAYPNSVDIGPDEELFGGIAGYYGPSDFWIYNADDSLKTNSYLSGYADTIEDRGVVASGDGVIAIAITSDPNLVFFRTY